MIILRNKIKKKNIIPYIFLIPSFAGVLVFNLIPFMDSVKRAFFSAVGSKFTGINNFRIILRNDAFKLAATNTLKFIFICIPLLMSIS